LCYGIFASTVLYDVFVCAVRVRVGVFKRERERMRVKASYNAITSKHLYIQEYYETSIDTLVERKKIIHILIH